VDGDSRLLRSLPPDAIRYPAHAICDLDVLLFLVLCVVCVVCGGVCVCECVWVCVCVCGCVCVDVWVCGCVSVYMFTFLRVFFACTCV